MFILLFVSLYQSDYGYIRIKNLFNKLSENNGNIYFRSVSNLIENFDFIRIFTNSNIKETKKLDLILKLDFFKKN